MPYKDVRDLVVSVDDKITEQMLEQLLKYMPKKEEVQLMKFYNNLSVFV